MLFLSGEMALLQIMGIDPWVTLPLQICERLKKQDRKLSMVMTSQTYALEICKKWDRMTNRQEDPFISHSSPQKYNENSGHGFWAIYFIVPPVLVRIQFFQVRFARNWNLFTISGHLSEYFWAQQILFSVLWDSNIFRRFLIFVNN